MKSKKKFVLAGLVLLSAIITGLVLTSCDTNSGSGGNTTTQQAGTGTGGTGGTSSGGTGDNVGTGQNPPVATVTTKDGQTTDYATVQAAVDATPQGSTITLKADVDVTKQILISDGKNFTLDLNGYTISGKVNSIVKVDKAATLTITDSSQQKNGVITTTDHTGVHNLGTLIVNEGTIFAINTGVSNLGTLTVNGGAISSDEYGVRNTIITDADSPITTVTGGTITASRYGVYNEWGTLTVSGGTISTIADDGCVVENKKIFYLSGNPTLEGKLRLEEPIILVGKLTGSRMYNVDMLVSEVIAKGGSVDGGTSYKITEEDKGKFTLTSGTLELDTSSNTIVKKY